MDRRVPLDKRKRTEISCDKCKIRKQKCDRMPSQSQCRYCQLHSIACTTTQPRKQRIYTTDDGLRGRLALLESLVKGLVPEADLSTNDELQQLGKSLGIPIPEIEASSIASSILPEASSTTTPKPRHGEEEEDVSTVSVLPDQQGQIQYIGPSSSFVFHNKLRTLIRSYPSMEFAMFGRNAAESTTTRREAILSATGSHDETNTVSMSILAIDGALLDTLVDTYFDNLHADFPILHEASFRETYENWCTSTTCSDPIWLCGFICVLILARRTSTTLIPEESERRWWGHVQALLPAVIFATNVHAVQALLLAALHLHNNNHRDACWNLTGTALRVAIAMGLHRADLKHMQTGGPLRRELRKHLWWTLYAFEQMQVSSYDRPSAIADIIAANPTASCPNERIIGSPAPDFQLWSQRLTVLLGSACKTLSNGHAQGSSIEEAYSRPLAPAAAILREVTRWKEGLPAHLKHEASDLLAPSAQRPVLLLHAQYHYIIVLLTKPVLLRRTTLLSQGPGGLRSEKFLSSTLQTISDTCLESGRRLGEIMRKLDQLQKYNALTWWDIFYTMIAALVLVLDLICVGAGNAIESQNLLRDLETMVGQHLQNPMVPGSIRAWGSIVIELGALAEGLVCPEQIEKCLEMFNNGMGVGMGSPDAITSERFNLSI